jgi:uncharacterized BrkB/YihY/UPF0761 family membrane protein
MTVPRSNQRSYIDRVRVLAALGALFFAYLAVIPGAVVGATVDSACAGSQCGYSPPVTVYLVLAFGATALALAVSAIAMALYAARPSSRAERLVRISLQASVALVGFLLLSEVALPHPVAALVIVTVCVPVALIGAARRAPRRAHRPGVGTRRVPG